MHQILVFGAGKIGTLIGFSLAQDPHYEVYLADVKTQKKSSLKKLHPVKLDINHEAAIQQFIRTQKITAVISSLPYYYNKIVANIAKKNKLHYFDLTEDVKITEYIESISHHAKNAYVPQCGLAPGFINIAANHLMSQFDELETVKLRVGALPINISNALSYALTWSTEGLINEYGNPCLAIENGKLIQLPALSNLETITLDGVIYEAFNTSGGVGSLPQTYQNKVENLNYKTIRYPGHAEKINFLMNDLKLNQDRQTLIQILEKALPRTLQDVVLVYVSVIGNIDKERIEKNYLQKFYAHTLYDKPWSAIQLTTAVSLCTVVDLVLSEPSKYHGFIRQEQFSLTDFVNNRFGKKIYGHALSSQTEK